MITAMVVDDEGVIRKGIKTSIDWEFYGIEIIAEACNGKEALTKALELKPHIVITDIRMPVMDGLSLCNSLKHELPDTKIIILSGYDEFSYAKEALKIGVNEYLLKPVGAEELIKVIVKLRDEIVKEIQETDRELSTNQILNENLPLIRSRFINNLLMGERLSDKFIKDKANFLKLDISGPLYQIALIDIDDYLLITEHLDSKDKDLTKASILNIAEEVLKSNFSAAVCNSESDYIIALININNSNRCLIHDSYKEIQCCIKKYLKLSVTIGVGCIYKSLEEITKSYREAYVALRNKVYKGKDTVIFYEASDTVRDNIPIYYPTEEEKELLSYLKLMDYDKVDLILSNIFKNFVVMKVGYDYIKDICIRLIIISISQLEEMGISPGRDKKLYMEKYAEIEKYETIEDIEIWIKNIYKGFINTIQENRSEKYKSIVKSAIRYVNQHYYEDITIEDIANVVYVTPNYFSRVFKEETGENFVSWLNRLRVEKSKLLLREGRAKTYEIADKVGYKDYKYFTYIFKKYVGCTPKEYRENNAV